MPSDSVVTQSRSCPHTRSPGEATAASNTCHSAFTSAVDSETRTLYSRNKDYTLLAKIFFTSLPTRASHFIR